MTATARCEGCDAVISDDDHDAFVDAFLAHVRSVHPDWPYPDVAIRNYAEATQRLAPAAERLAAIGPVAVHPVTEDRLDDWLSFFDREAFAGNPAWAACYCTEPHLLCRGTPPEDAEMRSWRRNREIAVSMLRGGRCFGYLAYVDDRPAAWVNASRRSDYALYRRGSDAGPADAGPADAEVVGISCFIVAPAYRRHGLATALLERILADAAARGVAWVEAYPFNDPRDDDAANFRGPRRLFERYGFQPVEADGRHTVMRRPVEAPQAGLTSATVPPRPGP